MKNRGLVLACLLLTACGDATGEETTPAPSDTLDVTTSQDSDASDTSDTSTGPEARVTTPSLRLRIRR